MTATRTLIVHPRAARAFERLLDETLTLERSSGRGLNAGWGTVATIRAHREVDAQRMQLIVQQGGQEQQIPWTIWCKQDADVRAGDRLVAADGARLYVQAGATPETMMPIAELIAVERKSG